MDDVRLAPLPPHVSDDAADRYLATLSSTASRDVQRRHLERVATFVAKVPCHSPRGMRPGLRRLRPRLGAVAWSAVTPELAATVRRRVLAEAPTLRAASAALQPLRGVLRLAIGPIDPGRLWGVLEALRVDGVSHERSSAGGDWFDYEPDELSPASQRSG